MTMAGTVREKATVRAPSLETWQRLPPAAQVWRKAVSVREVWRPLSHEEQQMSRERPSDDELTLFQSLWIAALMEAITRAAMDMEETAIPFLLSDAPENREANVASLSWVHAGCKVGGGCQAA